MAAYFATEGAAAVPGQPDARFPPAPLPHPPLQLSVAAAGDALLAHDLLVHGVSANLGPHIRYAVFFACSMTATIPLRPSRLPKICA